MTNTANQYWQNPPQLQKSGITTASIDLGEDGHDDRTYPYIGIGIGIGIGAAGILTVGIVYAVLTYMAWRLSEARS